jgi:hypothetical protein
MWEGVNFRRKLGGEPRRGGFPLDILLIYFIYFIYVFGGHN